MDTWFLANIIQQATFIYCDRFLNYRNDPKGRQYDQMTQAARSITANVAEGLSRHQTSVETEMKLLDTARASANELHGDYLTAILRHRQAIWSEHDTQTIAITNITFDRPTYTNDIEHNATLHILKQMEYFNPWFDSEDEVVFSNCLIILCRRMIKMMQRLIEKKHADFIVEGGFAENMTKDRLQVIKQQAITDAAPTCPLCGKPMQRRMAKRGRNQGNEFWSCTDYPNCIGTRNINDTPKPNPIPRTPITDNR